MPSHPRRVFPRLGKAGALLAAALLLPSFAALADLHDGLVLYYDFNEPPGYQVHQPGYDGAATGANPAYFHTADDGSNVDETAHGGANNSGRSYVNTQGVPFALEIPQLADWPLERTSISALYP